MIKMLNLLKNRIFQLVLLFVVIWVGIKITFSVMGSLDALRGEELNKVYSKKSSDFLLKELHSASWYKESLAYGILVDRKDKRILPYILKRIHIKDGVEKAGYIQALVKIGDVNTVPVIVNIMDSQIDKNPNNYVYWHCVIALAKFKYEPIWSVLLCEISTV